MRNFETVIASAAKQSILFNREMDCFVASLLAMTRIIGRSHDQSANPVTLPLAEYSPRHFLLVVADGVATVTLNRPERKNPLTFESYRELADFFRACAMDDEVKTIVVTGAGGNFSSGGDVFEIIGPLVQMDSKGLTAFTRMTGDLVKAMRACPQPIVAAVEGICAGAGAIVAMACDLRLAATGAKVAYLSTRSALPAVTWAPVPSCRASSGSREPRNCSTGRV